MTIYDQQSLVCEKLLGWKRRKEPSDEEMEHAREGTGPYEACPGYPIGAGPLGGLQVDSWTGPDGEPKQFPKLTLDWLHECVQKLPPEKAASSNPVNYPKWMFNSNLSRVLGIRFIGSDDDLFAFANATAEQRLAALVDTLKSIGLWES
jgi:hypothetical protein